MQRCPWCEISELDTVYHDTEWGVPSYDDRHLFEMLTLEGAQAGLSWTTILKKREGYRRAFANFDITKVASFDESMVEQLVRDEGIVRHRGKIESTIKNARATLAIQQEFGTFAEFVWHFVDGSPLVHQRRSMNEVPGQTDQSLAMSKALKKRGFGFVGPTTCYAFMQASGMVNDHLASCFRHQECHQRQARAN